MSSVRRPFLVVFLATRLAAWAMAAEAAGASKNLPDEIRHYAADWEGVARFFRLPASEAALDRQQRLVIDWQARLRAVEFHALDPSGQVDYLLLDNHLHKSLDGIARERKTIADVDRLLAFRKLIHALELARWRAAPLDDRKVASELADLARQVRQIREAVEKAHKAKGQPGQKRAAGPAAPADSPRLDPVSPSLALRAGTLVKELQEAIKRWYGFHSGYQPQFEWWMKKPHEEAARELDQYARLLREEIAGQKGKEDDPLVGTPIGPEAVAADIRSEFLPYSAADLIAIGQRELAWGEQQMKAAAHQMGLGADWKAALSKVKADYAPPGLQAELIERICREATEFVKRRKLVTVPPLAEETWRLSMIPPEGIKTVPYAAYGGQQMLVAYAKDEMSQEDKLMVMQGNNRHFMRLVTPHELIPGHHLQAFYAARYRGYRELFSTPFYVEGWPLYWELRLWDLDWAKTPEDRIGMLFWRMTRTARIVVSLKYHLGQMNPQEMVDFLINRVGHEKLGATSEVRRFIRAHPLYQAGYMIGGMQLYSLHKELVASGKMTEQEFHDAVLMQGAMPIELLRALLAKARLPRDARPSWRFAP